MSKEVKIVSKEEVLELFEQLLPWDKEEVINILAEKYSNLIVNKWGI